jgi:hypothetical protein
VIWLRIGRSSSSYAESFLPNLCRIFTAPQTHNVALTKPIAQFVVALGTDGRIISQGAPEALLADAGLTEEMRHEQEALELEDELEEDEGKKASAQGSKVKIDAHTQATS